MRLTATLTSVEVADIIRSWLPLTLTLSTDKPARRLVIEEALDVNLVEGVGIRTTCRGRLEWPLPILPDAIDIDRVQAVISADTELTEEGLELKWSLDFEDLDLDNVPSLMDAKIADIAESRINKRAPAAAWRISQTLGVALQLPDRIASANRWTFAVPDGDLEITEDAIRLSASAQMGVERAA